jgi:hypothetical protein
MADPKSIESPDSARFSVRADNENANDKVQDSTQGDGRQNSRADGEETHGRKSGEPEGESSSEQLTHQDASENPQKQKQKDADKQKSRDGSKHRSPTDLKGMFLDQKEKMKTKAHPPGGFDDTPLPDAPLGFTVKFIFHKAINLPAADLHTASSDPFLTATLRAAVPKRHKEDPDLSHRTKTLRKKTNPEWNDEWIVANVPATGFSLKCRIYDEDYQDHNDRLGNVTIKVPRVSEDWGGYPMPGREFPVKKRVGSKRAYFLKGIAATISKNVSMTPSLFISIEVLGKSEPPHAHLYTIGPTVWIQHYSPMIGRLAGIKVHKDDNDDVPSIEVGEAEKKSKKYEYADLIIPS